jgi:hypothetical protein
MNTQSEGKPIPRIFLIAVSSDPFIIQARGRMTYPMFTYCIIHLHTRSTVHSFLDRVGTRQCSFGHTHIILNAFPLIPKLTHIEHSVTARRARLIYMFVPSNVDHGMAQPPEIDPKQSRD